MSSTSSESSDAAHDEVTGEHTLNQGFTFRSAFALAFADISPIVALYAIFTLALFSAGPAFFWAFPIVLIGQLLVAAVFGELASRYPFAGSVYQWARHVQGTPWGWFAAWAYIWGLTIALSTLSYGASGFLLEIFGVDSPSGWLTTSVALLIIVVGTLVNMVGRAVLKFMVVASIIAEVIGSVGLGTVLLLFTASTRSARSSTGSVPRAMASGSRGRRSLPWPSWDGPSSASRLRVRSARRWRTPSATSRRRSSCPCSSSP